MARSPAQATWQRVLGSAVSRKWVAGGLPAGKRAWTVAQKKRTPSQVQAQAANQKASTPLVTAARAVKRAAVQPVGITWQAPGFNDIYPTCSAVAVASHLTYATGIVLSDNAIWRLHKQAGGSEDGSVSIEAILQVASSYWGSGFMRQAKLRNFCRADLNVLVSGLVVGISLPHDGHAVLTQPDGIVSWGRLMPPFGEPGEAWALEWEILTGVEAAGWNSANHRP